MKTCRACKVPKPLSDFSSNTHKACSNCCKRLAENAKRYYARHSKKLIAWQRAYNLRYPEARKNYVLRRLYGLSLGEYNSILERQGGGCAICGVKASSGVSATFHVDHCHEKKVVRGLLCTSCNSGLGRFKDNPDLLIAAADYLKKDTY